VIGANVAEGVVELTVTVADFAPTVPPAPFDGGLKR
jgi:hypothetical protein